MTARVQLLSSRKGFQTWIEDNPHDEMNAIVHERENVTPLLEQAKIVRDDLPAGKDWRAIATIPQTVVNKAFREGWFHDQKAWRKWANDSNNAYLRLSRGRA